jgi:hypothetical protein
MDRYLAMSAVLVVLAAALVVWAGWAWRVWIDKQHDDFDPSYRLIADEFRSDHPTP